MVGAGVQARYQLEALLQVRNPGRILVGELHHAVDAGVLRAEDVYAELGEIAAGMKPGRTSEAEMTIADLTGVGVLDAAVANVVADAAQREGVGRWIDT